MKSNGSTFREIIKIMKTLLKQTGAAKTRNEKTYGINQFTGSVLDLLESKYNYPSSKIDDDVRDNISAYGFDLGKKRRNVREVEFVAMRLFNEAVFQEKYDGKSFELTPFYFWDAVQEDCSEEAERKYIDKIEPTIERKEN
mgnify:FL=1